MKSNVTIGESKNDSILKGPVLISSIIFILVFVIVTIYLSINQLFDHYLVYYYLAFPFFIIAVYLGFIGLLLRGLDL